MTAEFRIFVKVRHGGWYLLQNTTADRPPQLPPFQFPTTEEWCLITPLNPKFGHKKSGKIIKYLNDKPDMEEMCARGDWR